MPFFYPPGAGGGGAVDSWNGRTGAVVPIASDYDANQIDFTPAGSISSTDVQTAIEELDTDVSGLPSVTIGTDEVGYGDGSGNIVSSDDFTFSPTASTLTVKNETANPFLVPLFDAIWYDAGTTLGGPQHRMLRAGGTSASPTDVTTGEVMGFLTWFGWNDSAWRLAGSIGNRVKSLPAAGVEGEIVFNISNSAGTAGDRIVFDADDSSFDTNIVLENGHNLLFDGSTSGTLTLAVPAAMTSHTLTFPAAQGSAGDLLVNDGSGNLTWESLPTLNTTNVGASNYSVLDSDEIIFKTTDGNTVTLPDASGRAGVRFWIKRTTSGGSATTIDTAGGNIDGSASFSLGGLSSITVSSDGTDWFII